MRRTPMLGIALMLGAITTNRIAVADTGMSGADGGWLARWIGSPSDDVRTFADPDPEPGDVPVRVSVYLVAGRSRRRAMVIGGVHNSEPGGTTAAMELVDRLRRAKSPPLFDAVIIPQLVDPARSLGTGSRRLGTWGRYVWDRRAAGAAQTGSEVEPNRNFPLPGWSYDTGRLLGTGFLDARGEPQKPRGEHASERLLPETRILLRLIERWQPERLASLHQHGVGGSPRAGDDPGVFVDPRGDYDRLTDRAKTAEGRDDDALARRMVAEGIARAGGDGRTMFRGNALLRGQPTVHYSDGAAHPPGTSLGGWAPVPVDEPAAPGGGPAQGNRRAITTVTVELPRYSDTATLERAVGVHVGVLEAVFLED